MSRQKVISQMMMDEFKKMKQQNGLKDDILNSSSDDEANRAAYKELRPKKKSPQKGSQRLLRFVAHQGSNYKLNKDSRMHTMNVAFSTFYQNSSTSYGNISDEMMNITTKNLHKMYQYKRIRTKFRDTTFSQNSHSKFDMNQTF